MRLWNGGPRNRGSLHGRSKNFYFSFLHRVHKGSASKKFFYLMGIDNSFIRVYALDMCQPIFAYLKT